MKNSTKRTQNEGTFSALLSATKGLFLLSALTSLNIGLGDFVALLCKPKGSVVASNALTRCRCKNISKLCFRSFARYFCFLLFPFSFFLSACQQEEDFAPQEQEIRVAFTTDAIQTRVNTLGTGDQWETGDRIRLLRWMNDQHVNYFYTAEVANDGAVTWTPDKKLYWDGKDAHTLVASYPNMNLLFDNFGIPSKQNTLSGLKEADCMNAMWKGTPTTEPINLTLKHRLSMVTVTYTLAEEFEPTVEITPEVYCYTQYVFFNVHTLERQDVAWEEGHEIWVKAYKHEEVDADGNVVAKKFTAIVSPDAYAAGDEFIRVTIGDQVLTAKMQEDITFAEGTHYTFDLKVGKDVLTIEQVSMNGSDSPFGDGWNNEEDLN